MLGHLDDVEPELRFDDLAHLPGLEREGGLLERRHHLAVLEESKVAAIHRASRIL